MKWITREKVKVDRVACPWLIKKFVDPQAEFLFVPSDQVMAIAAMENATPFDVPNVELGHHGKECSFGRSSEATLAGTWHWFFVKDRQRCGHGQHSGSPKPQD